MSQFCISASRLVQPLDRADVRQSSAQVPSLVFSDRLVAVIVVVIDIDILVELGDRIGLHVEWLDGPLGLLAEATHLIGTLRAEVIV